MKITLCFIFFETILSVIAFSTYENYNRQDRQLFVTMPTTNEKKKETETTPVQYVPLSKSKLMEKQINSQSKITRVSLDPTTPSSFPPQDRVNRPKNSLTRLSSKIRSENNKVFSKTTTTSPPTSFIPLDDSSSPSTWSDAKPKIPTNFSDSNEEEMADDSDKQRSALIRLPSRDPQVFFLADDPEAAAKIPNLLSTLAHGNTLRATPPSNGFYRSDGRRVTVADVGYTFDDLKRKNQNTFVEVIAEPTISSVVLEDRTRVVNEPTSGRRHSSYNNRQQYDVRSPFGNSPNAVETFKKKYTGPYSRTNPGLNLSPQGLNMTRVTHIEAECQDDYMRILTQFNGSFDGLIYSAGYAYDRDCIYVNGSGRNLYNFHIQLNRCGTLGGNEQGDIDIRGRPTQKNMMWNTLTVQYNPLIEEEWDEHFKVTCEYGYDFWKTVTFPFLDVEVQTGNPVVFTLTPPECHMEIRHGYGTGGQRINGPVRVGDPLTLVIYMRSELDGFDIVVSDCFAHNGGNKKISLIDHYGCPVDEKLISHFEGTSSDDGHFETQVYAFMKTFRFTGSPALYIECDVRMCHGECPPQPCHWKRNKRSRRSVEESSISGNVSETLNLFQSIEVLRDDEVFIEESASESDGQCFSSEMLIAAAVTGGLLLAGILVMCCKLKKMKKTVKKSTPTLVETFKSDFVPPTNRRLD